jgi:hypothetical protein
MSVYCTCPASSPRRSGGGDSIGMPSLKPLIRISLSVALDHCLEMPVAPFKYRGIEINEQTRPDAPDVRYITQLERENAFLAKQNDRKDQHLGAADSAVIHHRSFALGCR